MPRTIHGLAMSCKAMTFPTAVSLDSRLTSCAWSMLELWQENTNCLQSWVASNNLTRALPRPHYVGDFLEIVVQLAQSFGGLGIPVLCVLPQQVNCSLQMTNGPHIICFCAAKYLCYLSVKFDEKIWLLLTQTSQLSQCMHESAKHTCSFYGGKLKVQVKISHVAMVSMWDL